MDIKLCVTYTKAISLLTKRSQSYCSLCFMCVLTSQSSLMCLANVVWISVREQLSLPLEMSIKSCSEYMSSFSTKCCRSCSWGTQVQKKSIYENVSFHCERYATCTPLGQSLLRENILNNFMRLYQPTNTKTQILMNMLPSSEIPGGQIMKNIWTDNELTRIVESSLQYLYRLISHTLSRFYIRNLSRCSPHSPL